MAPTDSVFWETFPISIYHDVIEEKATGRLRTGTIVELVVELIVEGIREDFVGAI
jgi:hypothetical protein